MSTFTIQPVPRQFARTTDDKNFSFAKPSSELNVCARPFDSIQHCKDWNENKGTLHVPYRHTIQTPSLYDAGSYQPCCRPIPPPLPTQPQYRTPDEEAKIAERLARAQLEEQYFPVLKGYGDLTKEMEDRIRDVDAAFRSPIIVNALMGYEESKLKALQSRVSELVSHCRQVYDSMLDGVTKMGLLQQELNSGTSTLTAMDVLNQVVPNPMYDHGIGLEVAQNRFRFLLAQVYFELQRAGYDVPPEVSRKIILPTQTQVETKTSYLRSATQTVKSAASVIIWSIQALLTGVLKWARDHIWLILFGAVFALGANLLVPSVASAAAVAVEKGYTLSNLGLAIKGLLNTFFDFELGTFIAAWANFGQILCGVILTTHWGISILSIIWPITFQFCIVRNFFWLDQICKFASTLILGIGAGAGFSTGIGAPVALVLVKLINWIRQAPGSTQGISLIRKLIEDRWINGVQSTANFARRFPFLNDEQHRNMAAQLIYAADSIVKFIIRYFILVKVGQTVCSLGFQAEDLLLGYAKAAVKFVTGLEAAVQVAKAPAVLLEHVGNSLIEIRDCVYDWKTCGNVISTPATIVWNAMVQSLSKIIEAAPDKGAQGPAQEVVDSINDKVSSEKGLELGEMISGMQRWTIDYAIPAVRKYCEENQQLCIGVGVSFLAVLITASFVNKTATSTAPIRISTTFEPGNFLPRPINTPSEAKAWIHYETNYAPLVNLNDERRTTMDEKQKALLEKQRVEMEKQRVILQQRYNNWSNNDVPDRVLGQIRDFDTSPDGYHPSMTVANRLDQMNYDGYVVNRTPLQLLESLSANQPVSRPYQLAKEDVIQRHHQRVISEGKRLNDEFMLKDYYADQKANRDAQKEVKATESKYRENIKQGIALGKLAGSVDAIGGAQGHTDPQTPASSQSPSSSSSFFTPNLFPEA